MDSAAGSACGADFVSLRGDTLLSTELVSVSYGWVSACQRLATAVHACVCELRRLVSRRRADLHGARPP
jgi:hypothetical protein